MGALPGVGEWYVPDGLWNNMQKDLFKFKIPYPHTRLRCATSQIYLSYNLIIVDQYFNAMQRCWGKLIYDSGTLKLDIWKIIKMNLAFFISLNTG